MLKSEPVSISDWWFEWDSSDWWWWGILYESDDIESKSWIASLIFDAFPAHFRQVLAVLGDEKISKTTISSNSQTVHLQFWIKSLIRQTYRARSHNHHTRGEDFINYVFEHSLLLDRVQYYLCASLKRCCLVRVLILYNLVPYVASEIVLALHFNEDINVTENSDRLGTNGYLLPPTKFHLNLTPVL